MAAKWKEPPRDALDTMVLAQADLPSLDDTEVCITTIVTIILSNYTNDVYTYDTYSNWSTCPSTPY
jgi:hypothetical protein